MAVAALFPLAQLNNAFLNMSPSRCYVLHTLTRNQQIRVFMTAQGYDNDHLVAFAMVVSERKVALLRNAGGEDDGDNASRAFMAEILSGIPGLFPRLAQLGADTFVRDLTNNGGNPLEVMFNDLPDPANAQAAVAWGAARFNALIDARVAQGIGVNSMVQPLFTFIVSIGKLGEGSKQWAKDRLRSISNDFPDVDLPDKKSRSKTFELITHLLTAKKTALLQIANANPAPNGPPADVRAQVEFNQFMNMVLTEVQTLAGNLSPRLADTVERTRGAGFTGLELVKETLNATETVAHWDVVLANPHFATEMNEILHANTQMAIHPYAPFEGEAGHASKFPMIIYLCKQLQKKILGSSTWSDYAGGEPKHMKVFLDAIVDDAVRIQGLGMPQLANNAPGPLARGTAQAPTFHYRLFH